MFTSYTGNSFIHQSSTFPEQEAETEVVLNGMLVLIISQLGTFRKK